jgi:hypothetical protein
MTKRPNLLSLLPMIAALLQQGACSNDGVYERGVPAASIKQSSMGNDVEAGGEQPAPGSVHGDEPDYAPWLNLIDDTQYTTRAKRDIYPVGRQRHERINEEISTRARRRLDPELPEEHFETSGSRGDAGEEASLEASEGLGSNPSPRKAPMHTAYSVQPITGGPSTAVWRRHYSSYREQQSERPREHGGVLSASVKDDLSNGVVPSPPQCPLPARLSNIVALNCGATILLTVAIIILLLKRARCGNWVGAAVGAKPLINRDQFSTLPMAGSCLMTST